MKTLQFVAETAADAVAKIRSELGPEAVVLEVKQIAPQGISRLWQKNQIQVTACLPEPQNPPPEEVNPIEALRQEIQTLKQKLPSQESSVPRMDRSLDVYDESTPMPATPTTPTQLYNGWRCGNFLESMGIMPFCIRKVIDQLILQHGPTPPESTSEEYHLSRLALKQLWSQAQSKRSPENSSIHVFIGPSGSGKTTCLSKILAQSVLVNGMKAEVWRLDGRLPNTAEMLSVFCDALQVPVHRTFHGQTASANADLMLIDIPGVSGNDPTAIQDLAKMLQRLPPCQKHLTLNAAYEIPLLLSHIRAFAPLGIDDLVFTHLDEEMRWGKLWNFVLGTNYTVRYLSAGQNVPGDFYEATPDRLLYPQTWAK